MAPSEAQFIREKVRLYQRPLVLQIACDAVFKNRLDKLPEKDILEEIGQKVTYFVDHKDVEEGRDLQKKRESRKDPSEISKPVDLLVSILIPILGIGLLMLEFALLMRGLTILQAILLALVTAILGFAVLIFAGRSIDIIGESTFYKLFSQVIKQIPLLSNLTDNITRMATKIKKN